MVSSWTQPWRSLRRRPAFLLATTLTLALGTGVTIAVFSLVDTVLLKPLPYPQSDCLVVIYESSPSARAKTSLVAPARLGDWTRLNASFTALSGSYSENVTDTSGAEPERLDARRVMPRFFDVYGTPPLVGRFFNPDEEIENGPGAAIISERFWTRRFQRDPGVVNAALNIGGKPYQIAGVMPAAFSTATDVWLPAQLGPGPLAARNARFLSGIGRLRPGITLQAARRDLDNVQAALAREFPKTDAGWSAELTPLKEVRVRGSARPLVLIFGAVTALWILSVTNIAGLTFVQIHRRERELAIRAALGASRPRVVAAVAREGSIVAGIGGAGGVLLAAWLVQAMPVVLENTPRIGELTFDLRASLFAVLTIVLAGFASGVLPALVLTRRELARTLASSRGIAGGGHALQKLLVVGQVAVSVLLVGTATLLLQSYYNLTHVALGFDPAHAVTFHVAARWDEDRGGVGRLQQQLLDSLQQLPHVEAAGMTNFLPATGATLRYPVKLEGVAGPESDGTMTAGFRTISGGYLRAIRAPLVAGQWCPNPGTDPKRPRTVMVNRSFVDRYAPGQNIVGRYLQFAQFSDEHVTVTGIVGDITEDGHTAGPAPYVYNCDRAGTWPDPEYVVRTSDAKALSADLRRIVHDLDPSRAIFGFRPLDEVIDAEIEQPRIDAAVLAFFAFSALILAAAGLYSLFMLIVSERARELAVRLAVGATPTEMVQFVMSGAGRLLAAGIVCGIALTAASDRVFRGVLFGVGAMDARTFTIAAVTMAVAAAAAAAGPAIKAARISPIDALRGE